MTDAALESESKDILLNVNNIEVVYDDVILVLRGVSLNVPRGEIVTLLGPNGAGKSTTLKAISGLLSTEDGEITKGEVTYKGESIGNQDPAKIVRKGIFQVMEGRRIIEDMTVIENLRLGAFTRKDNQVNQDIELVFEYFPRLKERTGLAGYLSGGEQQMVAIGRGLMSEPRVLLLDEPSLGLSPLLVEQMFTLIKKINETNLSVILVEQNVVQSLAIADRAYVIEQGTVALSGKADELRENSDLKKSYLGL